MRVGQQVREAPIHRLTPDAPIITSKPCRCMKQKLMNSVALITHKDCLNHVPPMGHPESPARLEAVLTALEGSAFANLLRLEAPLGRDEDIGRLHPQALVDDLVATSATLGPRAVSLDPDTFLSPGSLNAARRGVGAVIAGVDGVMTGTFSRAFCATRPPGHHAEATTPMGFCIWNHAAIGALYARAAYGLTRVGVVDFDVHHGNGSQELAEKDDNFFYASIHQGGIYPGSGKSRETAFGNLVNVPLPEGTTSGAWRRAFQDVILPALIAFSPELLIISAGFDGHRLDPLAGFDLNDEDYYWVTEQLLRVTGGKLVSTLEGGYHLKALANSVQNHVRAMMDFDDQGQKTHPGGVA
jgi:acetoin utilization deacetylase AcuC-like enzyme